MKRVLLGGLAFALAAAAALGGEVRWISDSKETPFPGAKALEQGRSERKPVVLLVWDADDVSFRETERAFEDGSLRELREKFVFVKAERESKWVFDKFREAFNNASWVYVLDPRLEAPESKPLAKVKGERKTGGGIPAGVLKEILRQGLDRYVSGTRKRKEREEKEEAEEFEGVDREMLSRIPYIGIQLTPQGAVERVADGSPAAKGGLKEGDAILKMDGIAVGSAEAVVRQVRSHKPGDSLIVVVRRGEQTVECPVTVGSFADANK